MAFKFKKLEIWKAAIDISDDIDKLTKTFSRNEMFVITSQMKRAADSISLNITEGLTGQCSKIGIRGRQLFVFSKKAHLY